MNRWLKRVLDWLLPQILDWICARCGQRVQAARQPKCVKCGEPMIRAPSGEN